MTADVESLVLVGTPAWHGLGKLYAEGTVLTYEQLLTEAELDWPVETAKIETADQLKTAVDRHRVVRRKTDQAILGVVRTGYRPIQNRDAFASFDRIVSQGKAQYETAGSLQGGSKVFCLAKMAQPLLLAAGRDPVDRYILMNNPHDGTRFQLLFTPVRVVCSNTLALALHRETGDDKVTKTAPRVTIDQRAFGGPKRALKEAERVMGRALKYYELFGEFADFLTRRQADSDVVETIISTVFPVNAKDEVTETIGEHRAAVETLFTDGAGQDIEGVKGTAWALLNAFAEYADFGYNNRNSKIKTPSDRAYSVWLGGSRGLKERANKVIGKVFV